jgi:ABC-type phosphate transport system substrate-binding protein
MWKKLIAIAALLTACSALASPEDRGFVVIVNKNNQITRLSASKVKVIFLRNVSRWPWGAEILPIDLPDKNPARKAFLTSIMASSADQMDVYWIDQKVSRSVDRPMRAASAKEARMLVASRPGAVAYVPTDETDNTVRVLEIN